MATISLITRACPMCNSTNSINVDEDKYIAWANREILIQEAFPDFNPLEREFVKTGYCPVCQKKLFGTNYSSDRIIAE